MSTDATPEPVRERLPNRRPATIVRMVWTAPGGEQIGWFVCIGWRRAARPLAGEVFLRPTGTGARFTSVLGTMGDDVGEMLSLLLQHGYTPGHLMERFKGGSLAAAVAKLLHDETVAMVQDDAQ